MTDGKVPDPKATPPKQVTIKAVPNNVGPQPFGMGAPTPTSEDMARMVATAVAEALKQAIPAAAVGVQQAQLEAQRLNQEAIVRKAQARLKRCAICGLPETACGGPFERDPKTGEQKIVVSADGAVQYEPSVNHIKYICAPRDESLFRWFQGVIIGGVRFLSDHPGHTIWIPKKSDIPTIINNWERNEKELSQRREAHGSGAGSVGRGGSMPGHTNAIGWR